VCFISYEMSIFFYFRVYQVRLMVRLRPYPQGILHPDVKFYIPYANDPRLRIAFQLLHMARYKFYMMMMMMMMIG